MVACSLQEIELCLAAGGVWLVLDSSGSQPSTHAAVLARHIGAPHSINGSHLTVSYDARHMPHIADELNTVLYCCTSTNNNCSSVSLPDTAVQQHSGPALRVVGVVRVCFFHPTFVRARALF